MLYFGNDILNSIVTHTYMYANSFLTQLKIVQWIADHPSTRHTKWPGRHLITKYKSLPWFDFEHCLKKDKLSLEYWSRKESQYMQFFGSVMPYDKFVLIIRMLLVADHRLEREMGHQEFSPWIKVTPILIHVNTSFKTFYTLLQHISIDHSTIGMKNGSVFTQ